MPVEEEDACVGRLRNKLCIAFERNRVLEKENEQLKQEVVHLKEQIASLRARDADRRSNLWKKVHSSISSNSSPQEKQTSRSSSPEEALVEEKSSFSKPELWDSSSSTTTTTKERLPRVPRPPPRPTHLPLTPKGSEKALVPPPPPPPLSLKTQRRGSSAVQRVPEVVELYRSLTRKEGKSDSSKAGIPGALLVTNAREMIGEIENRSAHLLAIKSDVETQAEFISLLAKEIENAAYREISDVEAFVKWLDEELTYLVDERAVLKHFPQWPERKADAMREAAFGYRDLKNLELEVSSFHDNIHQPAAVSLKRMQALQDKLEHSVHNLERVRETSSKKYRDFKIPWEWMLDSGIIARLKVGSMKLVGQHMNRVAIAVQSDPSFSEEDDLILQGVRFAFRVHQFVGGFNEECKRAFQELQKLASSHQL